MRVVTGNILALDLATATGWCAGPPDAGVPLFGTHILPSTGDDIGAFGIAFEGWLAPTLRDVAPEVVAYEAPSLFAVTQPATVIKLNGLAYDTEKLCARAGIRCFQANPSRLKKFFAGNGRAKKPDMVAAARRYGWTVADDNQADACACWAWIVFCFGTPEQKARFAAGPLGAEERF